jgi:hypothetical protein
MIEIKGWVNTTETVYLWLPMHKDGPSNSYMR